MKFGLGGTKDDGPTPVDTNGSPATSYQSFSEIASPALNLLFTREDKEQEEASDPLEPPQRNSASGKSHAPERAVDEEEFDFRGFSTSISDMFADTDHERTDCCAMTCFGILQNDRDRYLITGVSPPSVTKRLVMHIVVPLVIFMAAGICAMRIRNLQVNQVASTGLVLVMLYYFTLQCAKGRAKRSEVRKDLLFVKHQMQQQDLLTKRASSRQQRQRAAILMNSGRPEDDEEYSSGGDDHEYFLGQTKRDIRCAHPCCLMGFYPEDRPARRRTRDSSFCSNLYELICPDFCGRHCQLCGVCAIAQEAREVERTILPPPYRRLDYITMEPMLNYYQEIYERRHNVSSADDSTTWTTRHRYAIFGHPLSRLSHGIVRAFLIAMAILLFWSVVGPLYWQKLIGKRGKISTFRLCHFFILILTMLQSAGFMVAARYIVDRFKPCQLSLDATIKYFASGFFLSASLAVFWELLLSQIIDVFVSLLLAVSGISSIEDPETDMKFPRNGNDSIYQSNYGASIGKSEYATAFGLDHPFLFTIYLLVATFIVAALIEEMSKYFGFVMVEHPDFMSKQDLQDASNVLSRKDGTSGEDETENEDTSRSRRTRTDFQLHRQSIQAQGGAITMAMVAVAIGFTCCENLLYVFLYSGKSFAMELGVLIERTFFPVHLILAGIQSTGMCSRLLEGNQKMKIGFIICPSVIIHGTFDFLILFIAFMSKVFGQRYEAGDLTVSNTAEFISLFSSVTIMIGACFYLAMESTRQRERLADADNQLSVDRSRLI